MLIDNYYYNKLHNESQKRLYNVLNRAFTSYESFPIFIRDAHIDEDEFLLVYHALYYDRVIPQMPPISALHVKVGKDIAILGCDENAIVSRKEVSACEQFGRRLICEIGVEKHDTQYRRFLNAVTRRICENAVYRLDDESYGEDPRGVLLGHRGYCVGFCRTVKYIADMAGVPVICVTGWLKKDYSGIPNPDSNDPHGDIRHAWSAVYDEFLNKLIYFDPTAHVHMCSYKLNREFADRHYRVDYSGRRFLDLEFMDLGAMQQKYILEERI